MGNLLVLLLMTLLSSGTALQDTRPPTRIDVSTSSASTSSELATAVDTIRQQADAFVFLSGGASNMRAQEQAQLRAMFAALGDLASQRRIAVGDGGTRAGIMRAAGDARRATGGRFALVGIAPAREIAPRGKTPVDPNHSLIVAVEDPSLAPDREGWGSETSTMYDIFGRLAQGRPSVTVVANGGGIALEEVAANVSARRRMIVIEGSGRAADALVSALRGSVPADPRLAAQYQQIVARKLVAQPDLYLVVPLSSGAVGLRAALEKVLFQTEERPC